MNTPDIQLHLVETLDDALDLKNWVGERREWLGLDIETEGVNVGRDAVRLVQLGDTRHGWAVPWEDWSGIFKDVMRQYDRRIVCHNLMFETKFLVREGIEMPMHLLHDTMIMAHLKNSMLTVALKPVAKRMLGGWAVMGENQLSQQMAKHGWTWATVPIDLPAYWQYGALDPVITVMIADKLWPNVQDQRFIYDIELSAISVMARAELRGIAVDLDYVAQKSHEMVAIMDEARPHIPVEISNPGSDAQVLAYLQRMGAQLWKTTDKGNLSCDDDVMKAQEEAGVPGAAAIRKWRRARWLENSHFSNIREMHVGGIIRPSIKPVGARTSRMSIEKPALQTVPRGAEVRDCYVARPGHSIISADYDQLELRVLADGANEEAMLQAIREGRDLHNFVATSLYTDAFTAEQRQICKNGQFAIVYGAGMAQFARTAGISMEKAE
jgi:DNA polymerase-1